MNQVSNYKYISSIHKILAKKFPLVKTEIDLLMTGDRIDTDVLNICTYYDRFCKSLLIDNLRRPLLTSDKVKTENRILFVGTVIYIYNPPVYSGFAKLPWGSLSRIADCLDCSKPAVFQIVDKAIFHNKQYPEWREKAIQVTHSITAGWSSR